MGTVAVTGAGSGIGAATAARLRADGHTVIGVDLRGAEVDADLGTPEGRAAAIAAITDRSGGALQGLVPGEQRVDERRRVPRLGGRRVGADGDRGRRCAGGQQGSETLEQLDGAEVVDRHERRPGAVRHARHPGARDEALECAVAAVGDGGDGRGPTLGGGEVGDDLGALQVDPDDGVPVGAQAR
ncbi:MAG: hypothetical protein ABWZ89_00790, partial [Acidimicrobiales bacterium]